MSKVKCHGCHNPTFSYKFGGKAAVSPIISGDGASTQMTRVYELAAKKSMASREDAFKAGYEPEPPPDS